MFHSVAGARDMRADRQTDRQTDTLIALLRTPTGTK